MASILNLNGNCITLTGLFNKISQVFENAATVTVTITDAGGVVLVNAQAMPYVVASDGNYQTVVAGNVSLGDDGDKVTVSVDGVTAGGFIYNATSIVYIYDRQLSGTH
tara:strand:- start:35810 stop:36133 length:324 start_codon:yes stop_codon:yes gene_type:complete